MRKTTTTILLIFAFLAGLSLLLYPTVSNYWNDMHATRAVTGYAERVQSLDTEQYDDVWAAAEDYNRALAERTFEPYLTDEEREQYEAQLDVDSTGVMGYIEIESIDVTLPIYHGTDDSVLQVAVGHLEWSSLPVGGEGTHCVLSGHRGLPSAKLFTNLDRLVEGDTFVLRVLDEVLTYEVDQILIVEPEDVSALHIEEGKDLCTLVTCTPYGINSHRLLVRGHRVENAEAAHTVRVTSDAIEIEPMLVAIVLGSFMLLVLLAILLLRGGKKPSR